MTWDAQCHERLHPYSGSAFCSSFPTNCSGGSDVIFPSIHEFEKAMQNGFMGLWDAASNETDTAEASMLSMLGVGDWKIVTAAN